MPFISWEAIHLLMCSQISTMANIPITRKVSFAITDQESNALAFSLSAEENTKLQRKIKFRIQGISLL